MRASRSRLSRFLTDALPEGDPVFRSLSNFYREEFLKCQRCLEAHRELYSERAITDAERALSKVLAELDALCSQADADQVVGQLLQKFDVITRLTGWSDPRQIH